MNIKGSESVGLKVIVYSDNSEIGIVKDIVYSPKKNKVIAFLVDEGEILTEAKLVPIEEVKMLNKDGLYVKSQKSLKPASKILKPISDDDKNDSVLKGAMIVSDKGEELGRERDIIFDSKKGTVTKFEVVDQNQKKEIKVDKVVGSGETTTIIKEGKDEEKSKSGGIFGKILEAIH